MRSLKKTASVIAVITAAVLVFCLRAYAAEPVCTLSSAADIKPGRAFDIELTITNGSVIGACEAELIYDPSALSFEGAQLIGRESGDLFESFDGGGSVRIVASLCGTRAALSVKFRFSPGTAGSADYGFSLGSCAVTGGEELYYPVELPVISVSVRESVTDRTTERSAVQPSKEQSSAASKASSQRSRTSSEAKTPSKQSSAKGGESEAAEQPSANTFYIQRENEPADGGQIVFLAAAGTAIVIVIVALVFFAIGRRSAPKKNYYGRNNRYRNYRK